MLLSFFVFQFADFVFQLWVAVARGISLALWARSRVTQEDTKLSKCTHLHPYFFFWARGWEYSMERSVSLHCVERRIGVRNVRLKSIMTRALRLQQLALLVAPMLLHLIFTMPIAVESSNGALPSHHPTGLPTTEPVTLPSLHVSRGLTRALRSLPEVGTLLFLSAVFAGLTIGIMGVDSLSLEIIAESGKEPDRSFAAAILPVRRKGHEMLCTLIIGNMLTNVVIVQTINAAVLEYFGVKKHGSRPLVTESPTPSPELDPLLDSSFTGAMDLDQSDFISFVVATVLVLIFAEIIPMSVCKSKMSLRIAAAGVPIVVAANMLLLPIVRPLGWILDRLVSHDAGQIYDRNELKRLMVLHCESHGEESGLVSSELKLLLAAMDFTDKKCVREVMTPLEGATTVNIKELVDEEFLAKIWRSGRSRIPVMDANNNVCNVLFAKDLLAVQLGAGTVGDVLNSHVTARHVLHVLDTTPLPKMLKLFQQARVHMAFVHATILSADGEDAEGDSPFTNDDVVLVRTTAQSPKTLPNRTIGLVTLEDVVEEIIREEIYDEYDEEEANENFASPSTIVPRSTSASSLGTTSVWIPRPPTRLVRVHFTSFRVDPQRPDVKMTNDQLWAVAFFMTESNLPAFKGWKCGHFKALIDEAEECIYVPNVAPPTTPAPRPLATPSTRKKSAHQTLAEMGGPQGHFLLYRLGVAATHMILILSGRVDIAVSEGFTSELRSFRFLGEESLLSPGDYFPDFTAAVVRPSRILRFDHDVFHRLRASFGFPVPDPPVRLVQVKGLNNTAGSPLAANAPGNFYGTF